MQIAASITFFPNYDVRRGLIYNSFYLCITEAIIEFYHCHLSFPDLVSCKIFEMTPSFPARKFVPGLGHFPLGDPHDFEFWLIDSY